MPKRTGGMRLLEAPKPTLKAIQRRVLREILDRVPPHEAAHGFRSGRGILSHARAHAGRTALLRMDVEDFFISIPAGRVHGVFRTLGYPEEAARVLTGLCTSRAPAEGPENDRNVRVGRRASSRKRRGSRDGGRREATRGFGFGADDPG
jgi:hypothetical protein